MDFIPPIRPLKIPLTVSPTDNADVYTPDNLGRLLEGRYYEQLTPDVNLAIAIEKKYLPDGKAYTLSGFKLFLINGRFTLPENVTLEQFELHRGRLTFYRGSLDICGPKAEGWAAESGATVFVNAAGGIGVAAAPGSNAVATVAKAVAYAIVAQASATAEAGAHACGTADGALVYAMATDAKVCTFAEMQQQLQKLEKAANAGDIDARNYFVTACLSGLFPTHFSVEVDVSKLKKASLEGSMSASFRLGRMYLVGDKVEQDLTLADCYFQRAYKQGAQESAFKVGELFSPFFCEIVGSDAGVKTGSSIAYEWYKKAAEQGHTKAQKRIAEYNSNSFNFDKVLFGINFVES